VFIRTLFLLESVCTGQLGWNLRMKESKQITLGASDSTAAVTDFKYRMHPAGGFTATAERLLRNSP
jgi:hypothetical protein